MSTKNTRVPSHIAASYISVHVRGGNSADADEFMPLFDGYMHACVHCICLSYREIILVGLFNSSVHAKYLLMSIVAADSMHLVNCHSMLQRGESRRDKAARAHARNIIID